MPGQGSQDDGSACIFLHPQQFTVMCGTCCMHGHLAVQICQGLEAGRQRTSYMMHAWGRDTFSSIFEIWDSLVGSLQVHFVVKWGPHRLCRARPACMHRHQSVDLHACPLARVARVLHRTMSTVSNSTSSFRISRTNARTHRRCLLDVRTSDVTQGAVPECTRTQVFTLGTARNQIPAVLHISGRDSKHQNCDREPFLRTGPHRQRC